MSTSYGRSQAQSNLQILSTHAQAARFAALKERNVAYKKAPKHVYSDGSVYVGQNAEYKLLPGPHGEKWVRVESPLPFVKVGIQANVH